MITRLTGTLESLEGLEATVVPAGSGLAYHVLVPAYLAQKLKDQVGKPVTLHTFHYLEGQLGGSNLVPRLIGFATTGERRFFDLLTSVDGLGNRKALKALAHEPAEIARAIAGADTGWLVKLPEIGKKTAEKVILELKGKVSGYLSDSTLSALDAASRGVGPAASSDPPAVADAIEALITLGETRPDAERKIRAAALRKPAAKTPDELVAAAYGA